MLTLDNLKLLLSEHHWHFDTSFDADGRYVLLGRSGSGKSTLLNLIGGFLSPDSGDIRWQDQSLLPLSPALRPITTLFQQNNLFPHLSVWKNIALGLSPDLRLDEAQKHRIDSVISSVGLEGYHARRPDALSGGEQQRVALARCLLRRRPVLLLDEPFSALDTATRHAMIDLLLRVLDDLQPCMILVTHREEDADALQAQTIRLKNDAIER